MPENVQGDKNAKMSDLKKKMSTYSSVEDGLENEEVNYKPYFLKEYMNIKESFVLCWKE